MRVTSEMMVTGSLRRLQNRLGRYERAQNALATGKWIERPSDDPSQASRALVLRAALQSREQELRAANDAEAFLNRADSELQGAMNVLQRLNQLAVAGANETSQSERDGIAEEVEQLQQQLVGIANAKHRGRALFAGFRDGDAIAKVAGAWTYTGDGGAIVRRVSDADRVQVNVNASDFLGLGGPSDLMTDLDDFVTALRAGDTAGIRTAITDVKTGMGRLNDALATIGATSNRIEAARNRTEANQIDLRAELAEVEDVDVAEAIMDLQVEEVAYQATLQALGRSLPSTLVAFLR